MLYRKKSPTFAKGVDAADAAHRSITFSDEGGENAPASPATANTSDFGLDGDARVEQYDDYAVFYVSDGSAWSEVFRNEGVNA